MLILLLSNRFPPNIVGGAEIAAGDMALSLRQRGHDVRVLTARDSRGSRSKEEPWIARTLREVIDATGDRHGSPRSPMGRITALYQQTHSRSSARRLVEAVSAAKPDVLYIWDVSGVGLVSVLRALREIRIPIVFQLASYWWHYVNSPETSFSTVRALRLKKLIIGPVPPLRFTTLIATSDAVKQAYVRVGCPPDRIEVIDNAIDSGFLTTPRGAPGANPRPVLMYAGRLCAEKGVMVALQTVDVLVHRDRRDVHLRIYGSGDPRYHEQLREYVRARDLGHSVSFEGLVARDQLLRAYDKADLVIVPSLWEEPFGLVAVEAMARAVPVVASDVGGLSGVVEDGVSGTLVAPGDPDELAAVVKRLLNSPGERRRLAEAGRQAVRERYTLDTCTQRVERHLQRALGLDFQECRWAE